MLKNLETSFPYKSIDFYYFIIIAIQSLGMFVPDIRIGVIASIIIIFYMIKYLPKIILFKNYIDVLVMFFIFYNTFSFFWFLFSGLPISVYIREYSNSILPMFFYFFAKIENKNNNNFFNLTLYAIVTCFVIGIILFLQQPFYYRLYLDSLDGVGTNIISTSSAFRSLVGLTMTGSLGFVGIVISFNKIIESKGSNGKIALLICIIGVALTFRRSALFVGILAILIFHYLGYFKYKTLRKRYFFIEFTILFVISGYLLSNFGDLLTMLGERLMMLSEAVDERSGSWIDGMQYGNLIIGSGLGVFGHKAVEFSDKYIPDGNYVRMLAELGFVGTFVFISIIIGTLFKGFKKLRLHLIEIGVIIGLCLQAIGSDIFSFQLIVPILWYSVGRINTN